MKRALEALKIHLVNPTWTLVEIGREMGLSRERVRQLLAQSGIRIGHKKGHRSLNYVCPQCGKPKNKSSKLCQPCSYSNRFPAYPIPLEEKVCRNCGKHFKTKVFKTSPGTYCSKRCWGADMGRKYGFGAHPEHKRKGIPSNKGKYKWDREKIWATHLETGFGNVRLSRLFNIPSSSISLILKEKRFALDKK